MRGSKTARLLAAVSTGLFLLTLCLGLAVPGTATAQEKPPIKVGIVYPISGVMGTIAIPAVQSAHTGYV